MNRVLAVLGAFIGAFAVSVASAQDYPTRPIKVVIPFPAGSGTDTVARPVLNQMSRLLGQPIVVENKPGAGGTIGMQAVAQAEPDGYTLLVHSNSFAVSAATYRSLPFNAARDFTGVGGIATFPVVMVASPQKGFSSLAEFLRVARANPGKLSYGSAGVGGAGHLGAERFRLAANIQAVHVPYKGAAEPIPDVMTGRIDYYFAPVGMVRGQVAEGKLVALAIQSKNRSSGLPDVPTTIEAGLQDSDYDAWIGMMAPARTQRAVVEKLNATLTTALKSAEVTETLRKLVAEPVVTSVDAFNETLKRDLALNADLVRSANVKIDN